VRLRTALVPRLGIVLGSGLGGLANRLEDAVAIPFANLPGWPAATAPGHAGRLFVGYLDGVPVAALQGRFHLYEGYPAGLVVQPVLLMGRLGTRAVLLTNAAGGIDPAYRPGTLMIIRDHLNLSGASPLAGPNDDLLGPRFLDLTQAWSVRLQELLRRAAADLGIDLVEGVYAQLRGPNYETPAEIRMLGLVGASAVGMSTVVEAIAARWAGLEIAGLSLITNQAAGVAGETARAGEGAKTDEAARTGETARTGALLTHQEVLAAGAEAAPRLEALVRRFAVLVALEEQ
jgi:purine-nucleoside phosphorylase